MNKPPSTLVDRPAQRDWTIWFAGAFVAITHLWDVVSIYLLDPETFQVLRPQGYVVALVAELLLAAMTGTFIVVVLTTSRRGIRNRRYRRYLVRNVTILTSAASARPPLLPHTPSGAPSLEAVSEARGISQGLPSPRPRLAVIRQRFNDGKSANSTGTDRGWHGHG